VVASQNGWRANDISVTSVRVIPGTSRSVRVRSDAPGTLLLEVAAAFHRWVEPIDAGQLDDWGYAERPIRGDTVLSNHASGTAIDLNALKHGLGTDPLASFTPAQVNTIHRILAAAGGVVRWGGDYVGRRDPMHFEVNDGKTLADCERALASLRAWPDTDPVPPPPGVTLTYGMHHPDIRRLQSILTTRYPAYAHWTPITDYFGDQTLAAVKEFQRRSGLVPDGIVGARTRAALGM
jgi:hypothetical protein